MTDEHVTSFSCPYCLVDLAIPAADLSDGHQVTCPSCGKHSQLRRNPSLGQEGYGFAGKAWSLRPLD
ncbi:MAG: hypothetical protein PVJ02_13675 [Gemmatimonadota bacterium]|jgi:transposase